MKRRGNILGFLREFLERKAREFTKELEWEAFGDVLVLFVYGLVLFPNFEDFIDFTTITVFCAILKEKENIIHELLVDVFHTPHIQHVKRDGTILCCFPVLYT